MSKDDIGSDDPTLWMEWVGIAISDSIASLASMHAGNVRAIVVSDDPTALDAKKLGARASVPCSAQVEMHLTPKVDDVGADRVGKVINPSSFSESLTSALEAASHHHWLLRGASITITSAEKLAMFVASNGEAYTRPDNKSRLHEKPRSAMDGSPVGVRGALAYAALVVAAIGALVWRVKILGHADSGYQQLAQQVEMMPVRQQRFSRGYGSGSGSTVLEVAESGGCFRRNVKTARDDKDKSSTGPPE
ncbi:unnamed protein product [Laminaria digitata]